MECERILNHDQSTAASLRRNACGPRGPLVVAGRGRCARQANLVRGGLHRVTGCLWSMAGDGDRSCRGWSGTLVFGPPPSEEIADCIEVVDCAGRARECKDSHAPEFAWRRIDLWWPAIQCQARMPQSKRRRCLVSRTSTRSRAKAFAGGSMVRRLGLEMPR